MSNNNIFNNTTNLQEVLEILQNKAAGGTSSAVPTCTIEINNKMRDSFHWIGYLSYENGNIIQRWWYDEDNHNMPSSFNPNQTRNTLTNVLCGQVFMFTCESGFDDSSTLTPFVDVYYDGYVVPLTSNAIHTISIKIPLAT